MRSYKKEEMKKKMAKVVEDVLGEGKKKKDDDDDDKVPRSALLSRFTYVTEDGKYLLEVLKS